MRTILADNDEVKFKSLCQEHSDGGPRSEPTSEPVEPSQAVEDLEKVTLRKQRLQQLEENFYELVEPAEVAERLDLAEALVDFIYQYWKLKRRANANQPLLTPKTDEVDNLAQQEQDVLYRRLKLFTHLRQDLERVSSPSGSGALPLTPCVLPRDSQGLGVGGWEVGTVKAARIRRHIGRRDTWSLSLLCQPFPRPG